MTPQQFIQRLKLKFPHPPVIWGAVGFTSNRADTKAAYNRLPEILEKLCDSTLAATALEHEALLLLPLPPRRMTTADLKALKLKNFDCLSGEILSDQSSIDHSGMMAVILPGNKCIDTKDCTYHQMQNRIDKQYSADKARFRMANNAELCYVALSLPSLGTKMLGNNGVTLRSSTTADMVTGKMHHLYHCGIEVYGNTYRVLVVPDEHKNSVDTMLVLT